MENEKMSMIFSLLVIILAIITIILGVVMLNIGALIILDPSLEGVGLPPIARAAIGAITVSLVIFPIVLIIFTILGMTVLKDNDTIRLVLNIISLVLIGISIIISFLWLAIIPLIPVTEERIAGYVARALAILIIAIIVLIIIAIIKLLDFIFQT